MRTILALLLVILLLPIAQAGRAEREAAKELKEARASLLKAMKSGDIAARRAAVKQVAAIGSADAVTLVIDKVFAKESSGRVLDVAVSALAQGAKEDGFARLLERARKGKATWKVRSLIIEVLAARIEPGPAYDVFLELIDHDDPRVRATALYGLSKCGRKECVPKILPLLSAHEWQVRVAAMEALADLDDDRAVKPLVLRLGDEEGRLRGDLADALKKLTGKDFGIDMDLWISWLKAVEEGGGKEPKEPVKPSKPVNSTTRVPTYYDIKILSDRIIFIIDLSLSMNDPVEIDRKRLIRESRTRTPDGEEEGKTRRGPKLEDSIDWWKIKTRLDLAKAQMVFALGQLDRRHSFGMVYFSEYAEMWKERLVKATGRNRILAAKYVETLGDDDAIRGGTNAWASLEMALALGGRGKTPEDRRYSDGIDTIFFLSDGAPSRGKHVDPDEILAEIRRWNRTRKIKIHVINITNIDIRFLRELARQNGGIYKRFKIEEK